MTSRDFCYWLQGFFEISNQKEITQEQAEIIKNHLNMVFYHEIDPSFPKDQQNGLNQIHNPKPNLKPNQIDLFDKNPLLRC